MKKRILSAVLVSGVTLGAAATVNADNFDSKIAAQDTIISKLTAEQTEAQEKVTTLQNQISSLQTEQDNLTQENDELQAKSIKLAEEIQSLSSKIVARNEALKKQARSAQRGNTTSSYINTLLNSKSISDAVNRIAAIREVVSANAKMLNQQMADKKALEEKQAENQQAINTVAANMGTIAANKVSLETQKANLDVAKLDLSEKMATAESEKTSLQSQKAEAERIAAEKAAAEAREQAESVSRAQAAVAPQASTSVAPAGLTSSVASAAPAASSSPAASAAPASFTPRQTYSSANTYPVGQCTWGVKSLAPWVGNYWGNGGQWAASAAAAGYTVSSIPVVGAVAVWTGGGYGHVAYVTSVESSTRIQVMESNYNGIQSIANHRGWFNPTSTSLGSAVYIYPN
ncbi:peptidoglycan hydrolase PcsB [Streptococcus pseudoporcinus]|uniref:Amidase n=1 Tax=Streptococcus pseudoporcinus TaxID=361101 RepID=A0A4U9XJ22_9STRE|nr:CHAP domain-containing protein [Streptococcus pseudoporcinus]VTS12261.1 amidase [Streptococcus pseudoporcinus]VUC64787.1 amidase [Streptococcus pseudoporcinus]VUC95261.1 amidase [Streptococcus pseudoporcinus]VUC95457.1 amidase [Streptococcus pseudoporcinus]